MPARPVILADAVALAPIGTAAESTYAIGDVISLTLQSTTGYTSFAWRLVGRPAGSVAALSSTSGYTSSITIDVAGEYRIQGVATGSDGTSSARVSVIVVLTPNRALRKIDASADGLADVIEKLNDAFDTLDSTAGNVGFYGTSPQAKPTVTGSRGGNAALASLLTALATLGLITDSTSA